MRIEEQAKEKQQRQLAQSLSPSATLSRSIASSLITQIFASAKQSSSTELMVSSASASLGTLYLNLGGDAKRSISATKLRRFLSINALCSSFAQADLVIKSCSPKGALDFGQFCRIVLSCILKRGGRNLTSSAFLPSMIVDDLQALTENLTGNERQTQGGPKAAAATNLNSGDVAAPPRAAHQNENKAAAPLIEHCAQVTPADSSTLSHGTTSGLSDPSKANNSGSTNETAISEKSTDSHAESPTAASSTQSSVAKTQPPTHEFYRAVIFTEQRPLHEIFRYYCRLSTTSTPMKKSRRRQALKSPPPLQKSAATCYMRYADLTQFVKDFCVCPDLVTFKFCNLTFRKIINFRNENLDDSFQSNDEFSREPIKMDSVLHDEDDIGLSFPEFVSFLAFVVSECRWFKRRRNEGGAADTDDRRRHHQQVLAMLHWLETSKGKAKINKIRGQKLIPKFSFSSTNFADIRNFLK